MSHGECPLRFTAFRLKGKFYLLGLAVLGLASVKECVALGAAAIDVRSLATSKYETLKTRLVANDMSIDWVEFRNVAIQAGLDTYDWHPMRERVLKSLAEGNLTAGLSGAQTLIAHNMANPEGHLLAMTVYQQMGMEQAADRERSIIDAIVKSIMTSGDGGSAQGAWSTVSKSEEEFVVNMVLDANTESQTVVLADGRAYDRRLVRMEDGGEHMLWFRSTAEGHATVASVRLPSR